MALQFSTIMELDRIDISVVVNGHREQLLIHRTLRSVERAVAVASGKGIACEILVVLDRPDPATEGLLRGWAGSGAPVILVDYGDLGLSRNHGIQSARGEFVAFVDGDDLISGNWLAAAHGFMRSAEKRGMRIALHPDVNIYFGREHLVVPVVDQESGNWYADNLVEHNYWSALLFARRSDLLELPYRSSRAGTGFGFEDWDWNCCSVAAGIVHKAVPRTAHFIRRKHSGSLERQSLEEGAILRPSAFFERFVQERSALASAQAAVEASVPAPEEGRFPNRDLAQILACPELLLEWRQIATLEPELYPSPQKLACYAIATPGRSNAGEALGAILRGWGEHPTHVILCPWLVRGGAELGVLHHVRALAEEGRDVTVVTTLAHDSPWRTRLPSGVRLVELGRIVAAMPEWLQHVLLARAILQRPPRTLHIVNSRLGYEALAKYGAAISGSSRIYVSLFSNGISPEGTPYGYAIEFLPEVTRYLSGVLSDNQAFLDWVRTTYGLPQAMLWSIRFPCDVPEAVTNPPAPREAPFRVLWAGRFTYQKFPAMVARVASLLPEAEFHVHGEPDPEFEAGSLLRDELARMPNVRMHGAYEHLHEIASGMSAFLYTSLWDGLPNVLLEATTSGLPVVASDVGGVSELIGDETGFLVREVHEAGAYAQALRRVWLEPAEALRRQRNARQLVLDRHGWRQFREGIFRVEGYL